MYAIAARIVRDTKDGQVSRDIPTFYLDENVQGILNEDQAGLMAFRILDPFDLFEVHVQAVKVEGKVMRLSKSFECRVVGHKWDNPEALLHLSRRPIGDTDTCLRCGTVRTVTQAGYIYNYRKMMPFGS